MTAPRNKTTGKRDLAFDNKNIEAFASKIVARALEPKAPRHYVTEVVCDEASEVEMEALSNAVEDLKKQVAAGSTVTQEWEKDFIPEFRQFTKKGSLVNHSLAGSALSISSATLLLLSPCF